MEVKATETMTVHEVARILRVSDQAVRVAIREGTWDIPHIMVGNRPRILKERFYREFLGYKDEIKD